MKTIYVKDKSGFNNGGMREIYEHQYDSRKHTLIGEASILDGQSMTNFNGLNIPDKNTKKPLPSSSDTPPPKTDSAPTPAPTTQAAPPDAPAARSATPAPKPAAPKPRAAAPKPSAPAQSTPAPSSRSSATSDDDSNASYWNREAERNRAQGGKPLPNEFNIFGKKDEAPAAPAPKAAAPLPRTSATPRPASSDPKVLQQQKDLISKGYDIKADGIMGPKTAAAAKDFGSAASRDDQDQGAAMRANAAKSDAAKAPTPPAGYERKTDTPSGRIETNNGIVSIPPDLKGYGRPDLKATPDFARPGYDPTNKKPFVEPKPGESKAWDSRPNSPGDFQSLESDSIKGDSNSRLMQKRGDKELLQKLNPPAPQKSPFDNLSTGLGNFRDALFRKSDPNTTTTSDGVYRTTDPNTSKLSPAGSVDETPPSTERRGTFNSGYRKAMQNEETDPGFSEAELAHFASIMEAEPISPTDPAYNRTAKKVGNSDQVGSSLNTNVVSSRDLTDEYELEEGRGRPPKPGSKAWHAKNGTSAETSDDTAQQGRDPRQHIQVIAGQAAAGRQIDFKHNDNSTSKITPAMGRKITSHLNGLKPADRQAAVNKMHDSAEGLKV